MRAARVWVGIPISHFLILSGFFHLSTRISKCFKDGMTGFIVPGYGSRFLRKLVRELSNARVKWIHWSERSHRLDWYLTYPIKRWYAQMVNNYAIGAFGCGNLAIEDFIAWGIRRELLGIFPYSGMLIKNQK